MGNSQKDNTDYSTIATILVFIVTLLLVYINTRRQKRVPPGPVLFPVVGNLPSLVTKDTLKKLSELRGQYGDVFGLYTGGKLVVFLNGYDTIHDALIKKGSIFMERAKPGFDREADHHSKGLIFTDGSTWKESRSFTAAALQEICYSDKGFIGRLISDEILSLKDTMLKLEQPFDVERYLNSSIANVVFQVVYGHRFDLDNKDLFWFQNIVRDFSNEYMKREVILSCLPFLLNIPGDILGINKTRQTFSKVMELLDRFIVELKNNGSQRNSTYVECFLNRIEANSNNGVESSLDDSSLKMCAYHLIVAGLESTASTMRWIILYLIRNPHVQDKMYSEILKVIGKESPSVADRKHLPYTHAVVLEGLRLSSVAPLGMPHTVTQDVKFHGYLIPKDCTVVPNLRTALMDPKVWESPEEFKPERFLNRDGNDIEIPKQFIPFSLGPRACLGETLARIELFLFTAGLVQKVKFLPEKDGVLPDTEGLLATTLNAKKFKLRVEPRQ